jgi:hypothetical protein
VRKAEPGTIKEKQAQMLRGKPARTGEREQECEEQGVLGRQFNSHESNCSAGNVIPSSRGFRRLLTSTVGTTISGCPPYRPGRALISASGSYLG